jgi:hypothetical protein
MMQPGPPSTEPPRLLPVDCLGAAKLKELIASTALNQNWNVVADRCAIELVVSLPDHLFDLGTWKLREPQFERLNYCVNRFGLI